MEEYVADEIAGNNDTRNEESNEDIDDRFDGSADEADADVEDAESTNQRNKTTRRRRSRRKSHSEVSIPFFLCSGFDCRQILENMHHAIQALDERMTQMTAVVSDSLSTRARPLPAPKAKHTRRPKIKSPVKVQLAVSPFSF